MPDETPLNPLRARLAAGRVLTAMMLTMPSVGAAQLWARSGFDLICIDTEHSPLGIEGLHAAIAATAGGHGVPVVRVPWNVPWLVKPALDAGAMGIFFPMINSAAEAAAAVRSVRYPPAGERGWGAFYAPPRWGVALPDYMARADGAIMAMLSIEHPAAVERIDEIARVPGVDLLFVAPGDLALTMGHGNDRDHPAVRAAIAHIEERVLPAGVPLGGVALTREAALAMIARGYRCIHLAFDWMVIQRAAAALLDGLPLAGPGERAMGGDA
jgi:4-hydroxy-2-oxoheptanedioate aldolase